MKGQFGLVAGQVGLGCAMMKSTEADLYGVSLGAGGAEYGLFELLITVSDVRVAKVELWDGEASHI